MKKNIRIVTSLVTISILVLILFSGCGGKSEEDALSQSRLSKQQNTETNQGESQDKQAAEETEKPTESTNENTDKVILVIGEWEPFTSENLEGYGFFTEIVTAAFEQAGVPIEYRFYPWKRCEEMVHNGEAWGTFPYAYTEERTAIYNYSDKVFPDSTVMFYRKDNSKIDLNAIDVARLETLKPYTIGGITGYSYEKPFNDAGLMVDWASGEEDGIHKLAKGRIDFYPQNDAAGWALLRKLYPDEINNFAILEKPLFQNDFYIISSKQYPDGDKILQSFNKGLNEIKENGRMQAILDKYNLSM